MESTLTHWNPFSDLTELRDRFDRILEQAGNGGHREWAPRWDVIKEEDRILVRVDVPGIPADEIDVSVEHGMLVVSGSHKDEMEEKGKQFTRRERRFGSFYRSMALPEGVSADEVEASCHDGVLDISIPLSGEEEAATKVEIKTEAG